MAFAALISAYHDAEDGEGGLRALLPMAGRTLLENQVRRAVASGARHVVVLVERVPAALNAALDRLRRDNIAADIARSPAEAADRFHPDEDVLLIADGLVAAPDCFQAMAVRTAPALLVVADIAENGQFERVDADKRWAGLALTDARTLAETAAMLGEWDLQSTLMRKIVQSGPAFLKVDGAQGAVPDAREAVILAERSEGSRDAGRAMLTRNRRNDESWAQRFLLAPLAGWISPLLLDRAVEADWLRIGALVLTFGAATGFWLDWFWAGLIALLLAGPLVAIAGRIDLAQLRARSGGWISRFALPFGYFAALGAMGWNFWLSSGNFAYIYLAGTAISLLILLAREMANFRALGANFPRIWPAIVTIDELPWLLLPLAAVGWWHFWPGLVVAYCFISLLLLQNFIGQAVRVNNRDA